MRAAGRVALTLAVLAGVALLLDPAQIAAGLAGASALWMALAVAALSAQIVLSALRWRLTARALGQVMAPGLALREYYLAVLGNTLLPGGVLGDAGRIARMRHGAGLGLAAQGVVIERLAGQAALALAAGLGAALWAWPDGRGLLLWALAAGLLGLAARRGAVGRAWFGRGLWPGQLALTLAILACNLGGFWAAARAAGVALPVLEALLVLPLTLAAMLVPLTVNGWGLREGAAAALWPPLAGVDPAQAVAASVLFGLAALMAALPGLLVPGWRPPRDPDAPADPLLPQRAPGGTFRP